MSSDFLSLQNNVSALKVERKGFLWDAFVEFIKLQIKIEEVDENIKILENYIKINQVSDDLKEENEELEDLNLQKDEFEKIQDKYRVFLKFSKNKKINCSKDHLMGAIDTRDKLKRSLIVHAKPPFNQIYWNKQYNNQK